MPTKAQLLNKMAQLETMNDHLLSELGSIDQLMRSVGFANGIQTVKATALELLRDGEGQFADNEEEAS